MTQDEKQKGIVVPHEKLSSEVLCELVNEFILREGTDYGLKESTLEEKRNRVLKQVKSGRILIFFDPDLESTTLMTIDSLKKLRGQNYDILNSPSKV